MGESVSFGKYENDDELCWEKWSTFSPNSSSNNNNNKYLEEVGKCSTPGSVAQKKAFFEAHYKRIAAMKLAEAEESLDCTQLEEDKLSIGDESQPQITITANSHGEKLTTKEEEEEEEEAAVLVNDDELMQKQKQKHLLLDSKLEEAVLVNNESMKLVKQHFDVELDAVIPKPKLNLNKVEKNSIGVKKKPAPNSSFSLNKETSGSSSLAAAKNKKPTKPASAASRKSKETSTSSLSLTKKKKKKPVSSSSVVSEESMSMNSDTASSVRRRSLFIEQMGDKDIVKRVFKTFQNQLQLPSSSDTTPKQMSTTKRPEQKTSTSMSNYQKENGRSRKAVEKINPATCKSGSLKDDGGVRGPTRNERRKEFLNKLEERSNARGRGSSKLKEVKDATKVKQQQKLNFKATQAT